MGSCTKSPHKCTARGDIDMGKRTESPRLEEILGKVKPYSEVRGPILQVAVIKRMTRIVTMETDNPCLDVNFRIPI